MAPHGQKAQRYRTRRKLLLAAASRPRATAPRALDLCLDWNAVFGTARCAALPPVVDDLRPSPGLPAASLVAGLCPKDQRDHRVLRRQTIEASSQHADA